MATPHRGSFRSRSRLNAEVRFDPGPCAGGKPGTAPAQTPLFRHRPLPHADGRPLALLPSACLARRRRRNFAVLGRARGVPRPVRSPQHVGFWAETVGPGQKAAQTAKTEG